MLEQQVVKYLESLRQRHPMPLTVALWNGARVPLGDAEKVAIRLRSGAAARYLLARNPNAGFASPSRSI